MRRHFLASMIASSLSLLTLPAMSNTTMAASTERYAANFKDTDIKEFINIVSKNLERTIIYDPSLRGKITVRSYVLLDTKAYYHFFLHVLEVHGYAAIELDHNVLKIVRSKKARTSAIPLVTDDYPGEGDEMVTRIIPVVNVNARKLASVLRQLSDNAGGGHVAPYDESNVIMITGRASAVERLAAIVKRVDLQGDIASEVVPLKYASARDIVHIVTGLQRSKKISRTSNKNIHIVADERTNAVVVTASLEQRRKVIRLIHRLDGELKSEGNTQVIHLKYAEAKEMVDVLSGYAKNLTSKASSSGAKGTSRSKK